MISWLRSRKRTKGSRMTSQFRSMICKCRISRRWWTRKGAAASMARKREAEAKATARRRFERVPSCAPQAPSPVVSPLATTTRLAPRCAHVCGAVPPLASAASEPARRTLRCERVRTSRPRGAPRRRVGLLARSSRHARSARRLRRPARRTSWTRTSWRSAARRA